MLSTLALLSTSAKSTLLLKCFVRCFSKTVSKSPPSSDMAEFKKVFSESKYVAVFTGSGVSAESGIPRYKGATGLWRGYQATDLVTKAFKKNPSLVWEFYHHLREVVLTKEPNNAHRAIANAEKRLTNEKKGFVVITQNIDDLHRRAGTQNLIEVHGSLYRTRCLTCKEVTNNYDSPICAALKGKGDPDPKIKTSDIPLQDLPRCKIENCGGLLRPDVVWSNECLDPDVLQSASEELDKCDLCIVVGAAAISYPAVIHVASRGVPVAEFNIEHTAHTGECKFYFEGPCGTLLPEALSYDCK